MSEKSGMIGRWKSTNRRICCRYMNHYRNRRVSIIWKQTYLIRKAQRVPNNCRRSANAQTLPFFDSMKSQRKASIEDVVVEKR